MNFPRILLTVTCATLVMAIAASLATIELAKVKLLNREDWTIFGGGSEWFWGFLQVAIVVVTLAFIYSELHLSTASHVLQGMNSLNERWNSERQSSLRKEACGAWLEGNRAFTAETQAIFHFFEELGLYVKRRWIPSEVIWELYSWHIESYWAMFAENVLRLREDTHDPSAFENFEYLMKEMRKINRRKGILADVKNPRRIADFAEWELQVNRSTST